MADLFMNVMCNTSRTVSMWWHGKLHGSALFLVEDFYKTIKICVENKYIASKGTNMQSLRYLCLSRRSIIYQNISLIIGKTFLSSSPLFRRA